MGFFSTTKQQDNTSSIPPEIAAHVRVMSDDLAQAENHVSVPSDPVVVPSTATSVPHGPFVESEPKASSPNAPLSGPVAMAVSEESAKTSPFLQGLSKEDLVVPQKEKISVDPPLFLSEKDRKGVTSLNQAVPQPPSLPDARLGMATTQQSIHFVDASSGVPTDGANSSHHMGWWVFGILFLVLLGSLGGAYYYLYIYSSAEQAVQTPLTEVSVPSHPESVPTQPATDFSLTSPNYLSLNIETVSADDIRAQIQHEEERVQSAGVVQPVEFLVTDQTNTPIAFSRFVTLVGLQLPESAVSLSDETFSLFFFNDQGTVHVGFRIHLKAGGTPRETLKKVEGDLPNAFQAIFFDPTIHPLKKAVFHESTYHDTVIRYNNLAGTVNFSIDYALVQNDWYIGTSKETLRALLDLQKK